MREAELWSRLRRALGDVHAHMWAQGQALAPLGNRTVLEALADGVPCKQIWHAVWAVLELPARER